MCLCVLVKLGISWLFSIILPVMTHRDLIGQFSPYDLKRLEQYSRNLADYHLITDLLPSCEYCFM